MSYEISTDFVEIPFELNFDQLFENIKLCMKSIFTSNPFISDSLRYYLANYYCGQFLWPISYLLDVFTAIIGTWQGNDWQGVR